jgi:hypothetical protein
MRDVILSNLLHGFSLSKVFSIAWWLYSTVLERYKGQRTEGQFQKYSKRRLSYVFDYLGTRKLSVPLGLTWMTFDAPLRFGFMPSGTVRLC